MRRTYTCMFCGAEVHQGTEEERLHVRRPDRLPWSSATLFDNKSNPNCPKNPAGPVAGHKCR
jgi:ribosomal protein L24E